MFYDSLFTKVNLQYFCYSLFGLFLYQSFAASYYFYARHIHFEKRRQKLIELQQIDRKEEQIDRKEEQIKLEEEQIKEKRYEDKYLDQYEKMKSTVLSEERLETLKKTILFENTPLGNLIIFYDHLRESFTYYSDNTIPYRFLEIASRHYVVQNNCKSIHIHMPTELSEAEKKMQEKKDKIQEEEKEKKERLEEEKKEGIKDTDTQKKSVFAKLKNYNTGPTKAPNTKTSKSGTNGRGPPQTNIKVSDETDIIVKERANRYSYEGKLANFSFLQKVEKKLINNRYEISFSDFLKMQQTSH
uniref:Uncharacterized protein n=1 Tax=viral metagenome TaxID=1070528 RepID=A0A6C0BBD8_9ZZZZ